ncbi:SDR family NAD(P)-dependent oxidoreductase [Litorihabitans aurantiacus]|uniref:Short-chain dehydrogenase n=1 Tax=Litorihabitans aurantiacus TaxID=1930061 RepID=A0AA37ULD2_9MICO|nr:SDR family oxidoreductase [Litorihabitans aurantiacus]GMA30124.1 short-chain dehydrogenase [Litorihabitans aurantiacus]
MGTALITGASAGLGRELAWQLAEDGEDLVLVARDEARLETLAAQLRASAGVEVEVLPADLSVDDDVARVAARLREGGEGSEGSEDRAVDLLVNNAGFGVARPFVRSDLDSEIAALDVMVRAVLVLTRAAVDSMVPRGHGAILNVGSVAALTLSGTYAAHKAWLNTFTQGLAHQLRSTGVTATVVNPGFTRTEFHARLGMAKRPYPAAAWLEADSVVADALEAVRRGRVEVTPSLRYRAISALLRALPTAVVRGLGSHRR